MSVKIDWAKYVSEIEKKIECVEISNSDEPEKKVKNSDKPQRKDARSPLYSIKSFEALNLNPNLLKDSDKPQRKDPRSLLDSITRFEALNLDPNLLKDSDKPQRKDPRSPLYSIKSFEALNLDPNLLKGVYEMGFNAPSKIQETALPVLLADPPQNLIAQSQPGTGKTTAFVLAMLSRVDVTKKYPQVLCLLPTYELAIQTGEVAAHMAKFCPEIQMKYAVSGETVPRNSNLTEHILIGTPGKVLDWAIKFRVFDPKKICVFVLNESGIMLSMQGHLDQCIRIHKNLNQFTCQMMFSLTTYDQMIMNFAELIVKNPIIIRLKEELGNIKQYYVRCNSSDDKYSVITNMLSTENTEQTIIFCHTRKTAACLSEKMSKEGHVVAVFSGDLTVEQRISVLDRFREGKEKVLIATNVLLAGIHVEQVRRVVNFDLPVFMNGQADCENYLHRICRAGRFGHSGIAINLVDSEKSMGVCHAIEQHFDQKIHLLGSYDSGEY